MTIRRRHLAHKFFADRGTHLAAMIARYDRELAGLFFEPVWKAAIPKKLAQPYNLPIVAAVLKPHETAMALEKLPDDAETIDARRRLAFRGYCPLRGNGTTNGDQQPGEDSGKESWSHTARAAHVERRAEDETQDSEGDKEQTAEDVLALKDAGHMRLPPPVRKRP